jgi:hypothetical protein
MKILITFLMAVSLYAQAVGTAVTTSDGPPTDWHSKRYFAPSSTVTIICYARPRLSTITYNSISNAAAAVITVSGGHGLSTDSAPEVTISGGTGAWVGINGVHKTTVINSTTFSVPVDSTLFSTVTGTVVITTRAPRENQAIWSVKKIVLDSSGGPKAEFWASNGSNNACVSPEALAFQ